MSLDLKDIQYTVEDGLAWIVINRPHRYNAFTAVTIEEMIRCLKAAWADSKVGVIAITGAGDKAFCTGGDQKQKQEMGDYGESQTQSGLFEVQTLHHLIRAVPKPVMAVVNGFAVGGGHVLQVICDLSIAAENAKFGQTGPKVGSFDAGFGSAYLAHVVGEKRAREIWFLCRQYDARTAESWGLVNKVVPQTELRAEARRWADEMLKLSPTALAVLKHSFNADTEAIGGTQKMAFASLDLFTNSPESKEGVVAFNEKRPPNFSRFRGGAAAAESAPPRSSSSASGCAAASSSKQPPTSAARPFEVQGRVAVVTGAASGIGRALVERCLRSGMKVVALDRDDKAVADLSSQCASLGPIEGIAVDVGDLTAMQAAAARARAAFGDAVYVLFNNAAVSGLSQTPLTSDAAKDFSVHRKVMDVNFWGVLNGVKAFLPNLKASPDAFVVNTASVGGTASADDFYAVTKHAVIALSETLQRELPKSIHVSVLCPSYTKTNFYGSAANFLGVDAAAEQADTSKAFSAGRPHPRMLDAVGLEPSEVADIVFKGLAARRFFLHTHPDWSEATALDRADSIVKAEVNQHTRTKAVFNKYKKMLPPSKL